MRLCTIPALKSSWPTTSFMNVIVPAASDSGALTRKPGVLVVPRDAVRRDGDRAFVSMQRGSSFEDREVKLGAPNAHEVVVESGLDDGAVVARNVSTRLAR